MEGKYASLTFRQTYNNRLHGIMSQERSIFVVTATATANLTSIFVFWSFHFVLCAYETWSLTEQDKLQASELTEFRKTFEHRNGGASEQFRTRITRRLVGLRVTLVTRDLERCDGMGTWLGSWKWGLLTRKNVSGNIYFWNEEGGLKVFKWNLGTSVVRVGRRVCSSGSCLIVDFPV
jgi:hypothetical protein